MTITNICVVVRKAPYGREDAFAGLRMALSGITHGMNACVALRADGVWSAVKGQRSEAIGMPSNEAVVLDIIDMGGAVRAEAEALAERGLRPEDLVEGVVAMPRKEMDSLLLDHGWATPIWGGF
jgi:tRNA 2-thiouridine synthesizing protein D